MGMIEISQRGRGGVKDAYDNFKESMKCLKEDFETLWTKWKKWVNVVKITDASTIETTTVIMTGKTV